MSTGCYVGCLSLVRRFNLKWQFAASCYRDWKEMELSVRVSLPLVVLCLVKISGALHALLGNCMLDFSKCFSVLPT